MCVNPSPDRKPETALPPVRPAWGTAAHILALRHVSLHGAWCSYAPCHTLGNTATPTHLSPPCRLLNFVTNNALFNKTSVSFGDSKYGLHRLPF